MADPRTWTALVGNAAWRMRGSCAAHFDGPLPDEFAGLVVHWPREYQHRAAAPFVEPIRRSLGRLVPVRSVQIDQPFAGIVVWGLEVRGTVHTIVVDYYDTPAISGKALAVADVYFKMQYRMDGYDEAIVRPAGYVSGGQVLYRHWCRLRSLRERPATTDVFGRFGRTHQNDIRRRAVEILAADTRFAFAGGFRPTEQSRYLREMARARVCLDLPGNAPFCYRLVEAMAMGCCVVSPPHTTRMPTPLRSGVEIAYCAPDLSDLGDVCLHYVRDTEARNALGRNAAAYFDRHLHPIRLAQQYLADALAVVRA